MKNYIVLGDNNSWYGYLTKVTEKELKEHIKYIKENYNDYDNEIAEPSELYVYEVIRKVKTVRL